MKKVLRDIQVADQLGMARATVWRKAKDDPDFPKPIKFPRGNITGWISDEVDAYLDKLIAKARCQSVASGSVQ